MFPSYRNQSVDLQSKLTDWFLYDGTYVVKRLSILVADEKLLKIETGIISDLSE